MFPGYLFSYQTIEESSRSDWICIFRKNSYRRRLSFVSGLGCRQEWVGQIWDENQVSCACHYFLTLQIETQLRFAVEIGRGLVPAQV